MANYFPLIVNTSTSRIAELPSGDNLDLSGSNISNVGNITVASTVTATTFSGSIAGSGVTGQVGNALIAGTVYTSAQPNITSTGTLTSVYATQYVETRTAPTLSGSALTLDLSLSNVFDVSLSASVSTLTISNAPTTGKAYGFTLKVNITGSYTITWPASVKWPSGTAPTLTTTSGKVDVFEFFTVDGGTTYYAFVAGQNL